MRGVRRRLPRSEAAAAAVGRRGGIGSHCCVRSLSSSAASADGSGSNGGVCPTVVIRRQFLLQVHPDFFARAQYAKERAINGENLKLLNTFLEPPASHNPFASHRSGIRRTDASPRYLHFYLKPQPLPARVTVPLDSDRAQVFTALRDILQAHCKGLALPTVPLTAPPPQPQTPPTPPGYEDGFGGRHRYGDAWARARANARWRRRSWQEHAGGGFAGGMEEEDDDEGDEEERPPPFLDLHLEAAARREEKWGTMQARRAAAAEVGRRLAALKAQWGFEGLELRVDWAAEHLLVALQRLEEALHEYYGQERASGACFAGLELVVAQHDIVRDTALDAAEGRLLLCPSDPPLRWVAALADATPETLRRSQARRRREAALVRAVQNLALPGAVVERGHTCPRRQYRAFLRRCLRPSSPQAGSGAPSLWDDDNEDCADDDDDDGVLEEGWWTTAEEEGRGGGLPSRPWEGLRLRVERGVRPAVLESGALQVDAPRIRSHACLYALVARLAPAAQEAAARHLEASARLHELERWCLHPGSGLGLASITREPGVAVAEATSCLERLLALRGDHPVRAALQGAAVGGRVVVGRAGYSWTREGVLRVPFDWDVARR